MLDLGDVTKGSDPFVTSVDETPTVDDELGARDEVGGQQIPDSTGDVGGCPDSTERYPLGDAVEAGGIAVVRRHDRARMDQIDAVAWRQRAGKARDERALRPLRGRVGQVRGPAADRRNVANHHERAAVAEHFLGCLCDKDEAAYDRPECLLDKGGRHLSEWGGSKGASGCVDDAVEPSECVGCGTDNGTSLLGVGEVGDECCRFSPRLHSDRRAQHARRDGNVAACLSKILGDGSPQSAPTTTDQYAGAIEFHGAYGIRLRTIARWDRYGYRVAAPNALSLVRIALVPLVVLALLLHFSGHLWVAAALFMIASLTDVLDGRIARKSGNITVFGTFIDSLADKLLISCTLIALVEMNRVWGWVAMVVVAREFAVTGLRLVAAQDEVISASRSGKIKMVLQVIAVLALILNTRFEGLNQVLVILMVIATVVSGVEYFVNGRRHLADSISR